MGSKIEGDSKLKKNSFAGLYLRNLGANMLGFMTIAVLNIFTPLEFFKIQRAFIFTEGGWKIFFLFYPFVLSLVALLQYRIQLPISRLAALINNRGEITEDLGKRAIQRLLNLPFIIALLNFAIYIFVPALVVLSFYLFNDVPPKTCLFIFFRTFMIGMIAGGLSFFLVEAYSRKTFIPLFFPDGKLAALPGTIKIPIFRRISILYRAGTLNPMVLLVGTLFFTTWEIKGTDVPAEDFIREILLFTLILCTIFVIIALRLNALVQRSIQQPIGEMLSIVETVKRGDFTRKIRVLSNDEIGVLGDAGNEMIAGLAERERIRDTFGKYVTPEIRDQILDGRIPLNGERTAATLLFSDLRDFTKYVEENAPEEVIRSMREYFTVMQRAVRLHEGLVLQYVGDEIEAVFGVPLRSDTHADKAVLAALDMRKGLEELNTKRVKEGKPPFRHGIGIHTGVVLAGNTGSEDRLSYALIGETVNLASRIEGLTKELNCDILVSEETVSRLENSFYMKKELPKSVKGYSKPITLYKMLE